MATVRIPIDVRSMVPAVTDGPQFKAVEGTNFVVVSLAFDASTVESAVLQTVLPSYGSGNLTLRLDWYADTATTGGVVWGAQIAAITPDTDSQDVETDAFATAATVTDSHIGTTGQRVHTCSITISSLDSLASGDLVFLRIYRDATNGGDTMAGDALLLGAELSYSDT